MVLKGLQRYGRTDVVELVAVQRSFFVNYGFPVAFVAVRCELKSSSLPVLPDCLPKIRLLSAEVVLLLLLYIEVEQLLPNPE